MNETTLETCTIKYTFDGTKNMTYGKCKSAKFERNSKGSLVAKVTTLTLRIQKVSANLSGSRATCSLYAYNNSVLQWRKVAHLKVLPPLVPNAPPPAGSGSLVGALVSALIVIVIIVGVAIATGTAVILRKRHGRRVHVLNADESK